MKKVVLVPSDPLYESGGIDFEGIGDLQKLEHVQPTLTTLVLGHERLRTPQAFGQLHLGQASRLPRVDQYLSEPHMVGFAIVFGHTGIPRPENL